MNDLRARHVHGVEVEAMGRVLRITIKNPLCLVAPPVLTNQLGW